MSRPRVGLDAHMLGTGESGNETYVRGLIEGFAAIDPPLDILLYHTAKSKLPAGLPPGRFPPRLLWPAANVPRVLAASPLAARRDKLNLLHATYTLPPALPCPGVVTVHDVSFRLFPRAFSPRDRLVLSLAVAHSVRVAARVITISESSRRDIVRLYGVPEARVTTIPLAAGARFQPVTGAAQLAEVRQRYRVPTDYILAVGNLQPRKNLSRLLQAYAELKRHDDALPGLVFAGKALWRESDLYRMASTLGLVADVVFTGYVPDDDLVALYSGALCFVYPSLYEGFGLPVLEAMASGTPVIASATSSLPEVAGDAALLVNPLDVAELARAIRRLIDDETLRAQLRSKGRARAAEFSWAATARRTVEVYAGVIDRRKRR